jgi:signal peptide peptidase SppA
MFYPHIASRAFHRPLLLEPRSGLAFLTTLAGLLARSSALEDRPPMQAMDDDEGLRDRTASLPFGLQRWERDKAFPAVKNVALIEVDGTLVNKNGTLGPYCGMTGYDGIRTQIAAALADAEVDGIALYIDSPGCEVAGCFDLADFVFASRGDKPILAIVDGMACSAAYALAAACDRITASSVGLVGSIGVIVAHADWSKALESQGIDVSLIFSGKHKADGNPFEPLPPAVRKTIQAEIDQVWDQFLAQVARGRRLELAKVKATEADTYPAAEAERRGLIDAVMAPADALLGFINLLS